MSKYHAIPTEVDGIRFHSKKESRRYSELKLLESAGEIKSLQLQFPLVCYVDGSKICTYYADFKYFDNAVNDWVHEDTKGVKTSTYRLKKKLVKALFGIEILET